MIPLFSASLPSGIVDGIVELLLSGKIAVGTYSEEFEEALRKYLGNQNVVTTSSFTGAVILALKTLGIRAGDTILASPLMCLSSGTVMRAQGIHIGWVDVDPQSASLSTDDLAAKISEYHPRAVLTHDWSGIPTVSAEARELTRAAGALMIEDASEAFGAAIDGRKVGACTADCTLFSFGPARQLSCLDGGAIAFKEEGQASRARRLRDYGIDRSTFRLGNGEINTASDVPEAGYGFVLSNVSSFIGKKGLECIDDQLRMRREVAARYTEYMERTTVYRPIRLNIGAEPSYWTYSFRVNQRDQLLALLQRSGISASTVHVRLDAYSCFGAQGQALSGVGEFMKTTISIPCGPWLLEEDVAAIIDSLRAFESGN